MMQHVLLTSFVLALAAPGVCNAQDTAFVTTMMEERGRLYAAYVSCSDLAAARVLSKGEVEACAVAYLHLKLSFLETVSPESYATMTNADRASASRRGYAAFRAWQIGQDMPASAAPEIE